MRPIDADEALRMIRNSKVDNPFRDDGGESFVWRTAHDCAISCVEAAPTIEVAPVKHGEWVHFAYEDDSGNVWHRWVCSVCGASREFTSASECHICGADMRERKEKKPAE